jgi:hypothetical protein
VDAGGAGGLPGEVQVFPAFRSPVYALPGKEGAAGVAGNGGEETLRGQNRSGVTATLEQEGGSVLPSPHMSDALAVLPPFNLSALELGMQKFLEGLDPLGPRLAGDGDGTRWWPWIVAGAAAATACEIARRELRRPAAVPSVEGNEISSSAHDPFLTGSS